MKDLSGPAFPLVATNSNKVESAQGMTKRELIAMHVMAELMGAHDSAGTWTAVGYEDKVAESARKSADALLAELGRE